MLDKTYAPKTLEERVDQSWQMNAQPFQAASQQSPFTIMMPPPNVTGSLHLGHALTFTLQDILIRYWRMRGRNVLWQPGTDHAGIATQALVERHIESEGLSRRDLGRQNFLDRVWAWKDSSQERILNQLKLLGSSANWERTCFTLDDTISQAVRQVFVTLYKAGLIYKDKRLVNWDPHLKTAISDLEVESQETQAYLYSIDYLLTAPTASDSLLTVATTRPETLFGDMAVAVNPQDLRYQHLIGQRVHLPLTDRTIPIIADTHCDPDKGTGAVKITPAHDFNDFEVGKRHNLEALNILNPDGSLNDQVPPPFQGMSCAEARTLVLEKLNQQGLLRHTEAFTTQIPYGDRSGVVIEPFLTDQWYLKTQDLAGPALEAAEQERIRFFPVFWQATYNEWLKNIQPWCISRQLWWGHQIPAWYGPDDKVFVATDAAAAADQARAHYGQDVVLTQDEDVLDTWFSSALWPFSTLGWPNQTPELANHYPTDVLVTGFDIIFFWVARMVMMGLYFQKDVPFRTVYIHALIRDEKGQKMSKSKGNVIDPLDVIKQYGADALRLTLAALSTPGRDIRFSVTHIQGYRNFITKLWNATRFVLMKAGTKDTTFDPIASFDQLHLPLNRWIVGALTKLNQDLMPLIEGFKFNEAAALLYQFVWGTYCDWYIELAKFFLETGNATIITETQKTATWAIGQLLHYLHPFIPFATEELWCALHPADQPQYLLMKSAWPEQNTCFCPSSAKEIQWIISFVEQVRITRGTLTIPAAARLKSVFFVSTHKDQERLESLTPLLCRLLRLESFHVTISDIPADTAQQGLQVIMDEGVFVLFLAGVCDVDAERLRLTASLQKTTQEIIALHKRLNQPNFVARAPIAVQEELVERLKNMGQTKGKITQALERLPSIRHNKPHS